MNSYARIYAVVRAIPRGKVATYGQVARLAGNPRWSRVVGYALHVNPDPEGIPCYRVVDRMGRTSKAFAFGGSERAAGAARGRRRAIFARWTGRSGCMPVGWPIKKTTQRSEKRLCGDPKLF